VLGAGGSRRTGRREDGKTGGFLGAAEVGRRDGLRVALGMRGWGRRRWGGEVGWGGEEGWASGGAGDAGLGLGAAEVGRRDGLRVGRWGCGVGVGVGVGVGGGGGGEEGWASGGAVGMRGWGWETLGRRRWGGGMGFRWGVAWGGRSRGRGRGVVGFAGLAARVIGLLGEPRGT
jgi:hypothetical protein